MHETRTTTHASRSLRAFWWTLVLAIAGGACFAIGLGAAFGRSGPDVLAPVGILMLVAAAFLNLVSLGHGLKAWRQERVPCRWLYVSILLLAATGVVGVMLLQL